MMTMQTQQHLPNSRPHPRTDAFGLPHTGLLNIRTWRHTPVSDPRLCTGDMYLETFWLGVLGPTATWLTRHLTKLLAVASSDDVAGVVTIDVVELGARLGVSSQPTHDSVLSRAFNRLIMFNFAVPLYDSGMQCLAIRTIVPRIPDRLISRFHPVLRDEHNLWFSHRLTDELGYSAPLLH
ncbi:MAG: hypothetical protein LW606_08570 [Ilumatobacteraceae bacterium]|nr:hypothetical protein [Ilumatobacteraceae bacterium]